MNKINLSNKYLEPIYHFMSRLGKFEWRIYEALILVVGGVWGTINLTDEVLEGDTHAMDRRLLRRWKGSGLAEGRHPGAHRHWMRATRRHCRHQTR